MTPTPHRQGQNAQAAKTEDDGSALSSRCPAAGGARRGVTLIEAVLFISLALGLIVGGLVFYQQASLAARVNEQVRLFSSMYTEVQALFRGGQWVPTFEEAASINQVLLSSGAVSPEYYAGDFGDVGGYLFDIYSESLLPGDTPAINTAWNTPSLWIVEETTPGRYFVAFVMEDIGFAECSRYLNSVLNGTLQSSQPSGVEFLPNGFYLELDYSVDRITSACRTQAVDGRVHLNMFWNSTQF